MEDRYDFCVDCGCRLRPDAYFCPECGAPVGGSEPPAGGRYSENDPSPAVTESRIRTLTLALGLYCIPVIILSFVFVFDASVMAETIYDNADFQQWLADNLDFALTENEFRSALLSVGGLAMASGIMAFISMVCVIIRRHATIAFVTCLLAAILCFWSIAGLVIGMLVALYIRSSEGIFTGDDSDQ